MIDYFVGTVDFSADPSGATAQTGVKKMGYFATAVPFFDEGKVKRSKGKFTQKGSEDSASGKGGARGEKEEATSRKSKEATEVRSRTGKAKPEKVEK